MREAGNTSLVVAADGGADTALALGLHVDLAIGDFDSVSAGGLKALERAGTRLERHPSAKDATDLELALDAALDAAPDRVLVIGSDGGRLDHLLSSLELLASTRYAAVELDAVLGSARVHVIHGSRELGGTPGELLSLHALHGPARGVVTTGLRYPLADETLEPGSSRGVSNVFAEPEARVSLEHGVLLAIRPGPQP
ncbi:MAG: thiamine diphosphokinase [Actinobacteria bacterium]|nr:thiamine diphosphokinase [Actinomycetota bacterium]